MNDHCSVIERRWETGGKPQQKQQSPWATVVTIKPLRLWARQALQQRDLRTLVNTKKKPGWQPVATSEYVRKPKTYSTYEDG